MFCMTPLRTDFTAANGNKSKTKIKRNFYDV